MVFGVCWRSAAVAAHISEELLNLSEVLSFVVWTESTLFVVSGAHLLKEDSDREVCDIGSVLRHNSELRWRARLRSFVMNSSPSVK
jgi:hypothetical protein